MLGFFKNKSKGHVTFVHNGKAYVTGGVNQNIFNG